MCLFFNSVQKDERQLIKKTSPKSYNWPIMLEIALNSERKKLASIQKGLLYGKACHKQIV